MLSTTAAAYYPQQRRRTDDDDDDDDALVGENHPLQGTQMDTFSFLQINH